MIQLRPSLVSGAIMPKEQVRTIIIKIVYTYFKYFILIYKHEHIIIWLFLLIMENSKYIQNRLKSIKNPLVPVIQLHMLLNPGQAHFIFICPPNVLLL